jgi:hypothetical protein
MFRLFGSEQHGDVTARLRLSKDRGISRLKYQSPAEILESLRFGFFFIRVCHRCTGCRHFHCLFQLLTKPTDFEMSESLKLLLQGNNDVFETSDLQILVFESSCR